MHNLNKRLLAQQIQAWLQEDVGAGDVTSLSTIPVASKSTGIIHVKQDGILAGISIAEAVFAEVDPKLQFKAEVMDGTPVTKGTIIATVTGSTRSILIGERLALNLLQRLSGIATKTHAFTAVVADLPVRLVDTRKTTPGLRLLEKYAVRVGGGHNHRFGLYDAVMIKDNHIKGAGSITAAVQAAREAIPHTMKIEVEVEDFMQLEEALQVGADIIMLDNMPPAQMKEAVAVIKSRAPHIIVEGSGSVSPQTIRVMAETGVDIISIGQLTYSVAALDISLDLNARKESTFA
ncbi:carboxylating nicotinate-nucleotide diphosphorylase [Paenibacillus sp. N1-5-1-14]|uniref:carboxylating nicotinate-nucleotide diphosphorylase n=1 Tax=Paenibacillus radicibacter TaxID=2972488 RepID=UPI00215937E8|nr:carboxylating nicotinate-nucleotide diphosphorylase [Paenibacillus radicibacter]MCR8645846.1 carboxylating nicotinate-nucleotide diphosphorylase [Paenibacillus radicibacter]